MSWKQEQLERVDQLEVDALSALQKARVAVKELSGMLTSIQPVTNAASDSLDLLQSRVEYLRDDLKRIKP